MVRYLFYTIGDLTYQSPLVVPNGRFDRPADTETHKGQQFTSTKQNHITSHYSATATQCYRCSL